MSINKKYNSEVIKWEDFNFGRIHELGDRNILFPSGLKAQCIEANFTFDVDEVKFEILHNDIDDTVDNILLMILETYKIVRNSRLKEVDFFLDVKSEKCFNEKIVDVIYAEFTVKSKNKKWGVHR